MRFKYKARTQTGGIDSGIVEAPSEASAIELLQKRGLIITALESEEREKGLAKEIKLFGKRVSAKHLVFFYRQLSILVSAGTSLVEALNTVAEQSQNLTLKETVFEVANNVNGGMALSEALSRHPEIFSKFAINMVKVGEVGGKLSEVLEYLANHQEREYNLISKVRGAMYYPAFILLACVGVLFIMVAFVMPRVTAIFKEFGTDLPLMTRIIIYFSDFTSKWWWLILGIFALLIYLLVRYIKTPEGKAKKDKLELKIPVIGEIFRNMYYARISENLATLIKGGIPIVQALDTIADLAGNVLLKEALEAARDNVRKGGDIASALKEFEVISPTFVFMVRSGEESGKLHEVLFKLGDFYSAELTRMIDNLMSLLEPVLLIGIGLIVAFLAAAVILPIYNLVSVIH